jgi:hypothetical protein
MWNFHPDFVDAEVDCTGNFFRKKAIEKTILRILRSSAFSHSLDQKPTSGECLLRKADISSEPELSDGVKEGEWDAS